MNRLSKVFMLIFFLCPLVIFCIETPEMLSFQHDGFKEYWHLDFKDERENSAIFEWTPTEETINDWTELITFQVLKKNSSKEDFIKGWLGFIKSKCPPNLWDEEILSKEKDSIFLRWSISEPNKNAKEEWVKAIEGKTAIFLMRYTIRKDAKPNNKWVNLIQSAKLIHNNTYPITTIEEFALN